MGDVNNKSKMFIHTNIQHTLIYVGINGSLLHRCNKATLDQEMGCRLDASAYKAIKAVFVDLYYRHYLDFTQL